MWVAAPYEAEDHTMGVLGVIGPTRMAYERVIPIVDVTAKLLGSALKLQETSAHISTSLAASTPAGAAGCDLRW